MGLTRTSSRPPPIAQFNQYVKSLEHIKVEQDGTILNAKYQK